MFNRTRICMFELPIQPNWKHGIFAACNFVFSFRELTKTKRSFPQGVCDPMQNFNRVSTGEESSRQTRCFDKLVARCQLLMRQPNVAGQFLVFLLSNYTSWATQGRAVVYPGAIKQRRQLAFAVQAQ